MPAGSADRVTQTGTMRIRPQKPTSAPPMAPAGVRLRVVTKRRTARAPGPGYSHLRRGSGTGRARPVPLAPAPRAGHTAGMNDHEPPVGQPGPSLRAALRSALLFGLGGALGAVVVWLATRPPQPTN